MENYRNEVNNAIKETKWTFWKVFWPALGIIILVGIIGYTLDWFGQAADVAKKEFSPEAALKKYEWFINQANFITKAEQDVKLFEARVKDVKDRYGDPAKIDAITGVLYLRDLKVAQDDLLSMKSNCNKLIQDYNAQSEKFNWKPFQTNPDRPKERYFELQ